MLLRTLTCSREEADEVFLCLASEGYTVQPMPLKSLPKGMHWHVSKPKEKGTLEATWSEGELRFEVRSNRNGAWQEAALETLG